mgnify:CR=1 FL=1
MRILVIRFSALGDVAMLSPVLKQEAADNINNEYIVLSKPIYEPFFDGVGENVSFIGADIKKVYKGLPGIYRLFKELKKLGFDYIIDEHDVLRTKVLRFLFKIHGYKVRKINKHRELRKLITAPPPNKVLKQLPTSFENYFEALNI